MEINQELLDKLKNNEDPSITINELIENFNKLKNYYEIFDSDEKNRSLLKQIAYTKNELEKVRLNQETSRECFKIASKLCKECHAQFK